MQCCDVSKKPIGVSIKTWRSRARLPWVSIGDDIYRRGQLEGNEAMVPMSGSSLSRICKLQLDRRQPNDHWVISHGLHTNRPKFEVQKEVLQSVFLLT